MNYIAYNHEYIEKLFKKFNDDNHVVYIANEDLSIEFVCENLEIYYVLQDAGDTVARNFMEQLPELKQYIISNCDESVDGIKKYNQKNIVRRVFEKFRRKIRWYYKHDKICD